jgi:hypothetical protein
MNTAPIKPLRKSSELFWYNALVGLLGLVTLGFAAPHIYKTRNIANLNTMSRVALGDEVEGVKFSAKLMTAVLLAFWVSLALALLNDGFIKPFEMPFSLPIPESTILPLLGVCVVSGLVLMGYMLKIMQDVKDRLLLIAKNYGCVEVIRLYLHDVGFLNLNREKLNQQAYNKLVGEHNERVRNPDNFSRQSNERTDYSDYYGNNNTADDDFSDNGNDYDGDYYNNYDSTAENSSADTETPFEILGVAETAAENEVKAAYRQKCILWHPDKLTPEQRNDPKFSKIVNDEMSRINNAYEQIKQRKGWT